MKWIFLTVFFLLMAWCDWWQPSNPKLVPQIICDDMDAICVAGSETIIKRNGYLLCRVEYPSRNTRPIESVDIFAFTCKKGHMEYRKFKEGEGMKWPIKR